MLAFAAWKLLQTSDRCLQISVISHHENGKFNMRFINPLPFVRDIDVSKRFYSELLGLSIEEDHRNFVKFESGFAIHDGPSLEKTVWGTNTDASDRYGRRNLLLYFEHEDIDDAFREIGPQVDLIHPIEQQEWGQRVFRFFDPDGHVIEIGEPQRR